MWQSAALAYERLRPRNRGNIGSFFQGADPVLPTDVHKLALALLASMKSLLSGPFIDAKTRIVSQIAVFDMNKEKIPESRAPIANVNTLIKLGRALLSWRNALSNLDGDALDDSMNDKLKSAPEEMLKALQLVTQSILEKNVVRDASSNLQIVENSQLVSFAVKAELIQFFMVADQLAFASPFFKGKIAELFKGLIKNDLAPKWNTSNAQALSLTDVLWLKSLVRTAATYFPEQAEKPWVS